MSLPTVSVLNAAIDTIYSVFSNRKTRPGNRYAVGLLQKMRRIFLNAYRADVDFEVTDVLDGSIEAFFGPIVASDGEDDDIAITDSQDDTIYGLLNLAATLARDANDVALTDDAETLAGSMLSAGVIGTALSGDAAAGDVFGVNSANDTKDGGLYAAKGSEPADNDIFMCTSISTIFYLGNHASDFTEGEVAAANSSAVPSVGYRFRVQGANDTTDNGLQAAKGAVVVDNDLFIVTNVGSTSAPGDAAVAYLGNAALIAGEAITVDSGFGRAVAVGDIFQVGGIGDTYDNGLQAAKGIAPADGDVFDVTGATAGSFAVKYLGTVAGISTTDEEQVDFVSLGS